jgi:hypothetical protein
VNIKEKYLMLFYSACGKATPYIQRDEQVNNAYWLVSLMEGVNLVSFLFILNYITPLQALSKVLFLGIFTAPFIFNYYFFLKKGKKKIISKVDQLVKDGVLRSKSYIVKYVIMSIVLFALSAVINNAEFQAFLNDPF